MLPLALAGVGVGMTISQDRWSAIMSGVEGWVADSALAVVNAIAEYQDSHNVLGDILEIGVHHGKFLIPLALISRGGEYVVGIDLFSRQDENVSRSGAGDQDKTHENLVKYCPKRRDRILLVEMNSSEIDMSEPFRIIDIDGGHTAETTRIDLRNAEQLLAPGGVVLLDDYYNPLWPGVHEGMFEYRAFDRGHLYPFAYSANKLLLCKFSDHDKYFSYFRDKFPSGKTVQMWGIDVVVF
jgi:SAM-dependent methyltransferase